MHVRLRVIALTLCLVGPAHGAAWLGARFNPPSPPSPADTTKYSWNVAQGTDQSLAGITSTSFTAGNFRCETTGGDAGDPGDSWTFTLLRAPFSDPTAWVDTDLGCVIDGDTTGAACVDATGDTTEAITAGDSLIIRAVAAGTPVFGELVTCSFTQDVAVTVGVSNLSAPTGTSTVWGMHSVGGSTQDKDFPMVIPRDITFRDLYCVSTGTPGGSATYVVTVLKSLAASPNTFNTTALTKTFASGDTKVSDTDGGHATDWDPGDNLLIQVAPTGSPAGSRRIRCSLKGS